MQLSTYINGYLGLGLGAVAGGEDIWGILHNTCSAAAGHKCCELWAQGQVARFGAS